MYFEANEAPVVIAAYYHLNLRTRNQMARLRSFLFGLSAVLFTLGTTLYSGTALGKSSGEAQFKLCISCHGAKGEGKQNLAAPAIAGMPAWYVEAQLIKFKTGVRGLHPKDVPGMRMRPMARTIRTNEDIKAVSEYVAKLPAQDQKATVKGDIVKGEATYQVCQACHGAGGKGIKALNAPPLLNGSDWYLLTQLKNFKAGIRGANAAIDATGAQMAPQAMMLDEKAMLDVIAYINALK